MIQRSGEGTGLDLNFKPLSEHGISLYGIGQTESIYPNDVVHRGTMYGKVHLGG